MDELIYKITSFCSGGKSPQNKVTHKKANCVAITILYYYTTGSISTKHLIFRNKCVGKYKSEHQKSLAKMHNIRLLNLGCFMSHEAMGDLPLTSATTKII